MSDRIEIFRQFGAKWVEAMGDGMFPSAHRIPMNCMKAIEETRIPAHRRNPPMPMHRAGPMAMMQDIFRKLRMSGTFNAMIRRYPDTSEIPVTVEDLGDPADKGPWGEFYRKPARVKLNKNLPKALIGSGVSPYHAYLAYIWITAHEYRHAEQDAQYLFDMDGQSLHGAIVLTKLVEADACALGLTVAWEVAEATGNPEIWNSTKWMLGHRGYGDLARLFEQCKADGIGDITEIQGRIFRAWFNDPVRVDRYEHETLCMIQRRKLWKSMTPIERHDVVIPQIEEILKKIPPTIATPDGSDGARHYIPDDDMARYKMARDHFLAPLCQNPGNASIRDMLRHQMAFRAMPKFMQRFGKA